MSDEQFLKDAPLATTNMGWAPDGQALTAAF